MLLTTLANFSALSMVIELKSQRRVAEKIYILGDLRASAVRLFFLDMVSCVCLQTTWEIVANMPRLLRGARQQPLFRILYGFKYLKWPINSGVVFLGDRCRKHCAF